MFDKEIIEQEIALKSDRKLFGHMVQVTSSRKLDMKDVMAHAL